MAFARFARDSVSQRSVRQGFGVMVKSLASRVNAIDPYDLLMPTAGFANVIPNPNGDPIEKVMVLTQYLGLIGHHLGHI